jgi:hypothetical protein
LFIILTVKDAKVVQLVIDVYSIKDENVTEKGLVTLPQRKMQRFSDHDT